MRRWLLICLLICIAPRVWAQEPVSPTQTVGPFTTSQTLQPIGGDLSEDHPTIPMFRIWRRVYLKGEKSDYKMFKVYGNGAYEEDKQPDENYEDRANHSISHSGSDQGLEEGSDILPSPTQKWFIQQKKENELDDFVLHLFEGRKKVPRNISFPDDEAEYDYRRWWWRGVGWNPVRDLYYLCIGIEDWAGRHPAYWQFDPTVNTFIKICNGQDLFLSPDGNWAVWTDCFGGEYPKNQLHIYDIAKNKNYQITSGDSDNAFYEWDKPIPNAAKEPTEEDWVRDGKNAYHLHRYSEAVECYQKALLIDPNDPEAYGLMGYAYYRYGQLDEAATALERSLQIDPNLIMSHYNLALVDWAIMTDEKKFNSIVALNQIGAVLDLDPSYETKMRDDSQFKKIFKSDEYSRWALRRRTRKIYDVVSSNPENMNLYFENLNPRDEDTANSMEMINAGKEQEKGRYVVEFKTVIMPPGATHDYGSSGSENTTYWSFDWPNRKLEKLTSPDDAQGEKAPYNRCLFSHFEFDSKPVDTSQLTRSALTEGVDSWTSDNSAIDHWVRVVFDQPVTFQTLHIVWPYPAQNIHFFYQNASGQNIEITDVKKISDSRHKVSAATRIYAPQTKWTFSPVTTTHLTILQKAGEGSKNMPNQMSLDQVWTY